MYIELPWPEHPANTYAWQTETLDTCFHCIRSHQQYILWSPPLEIEPATTDCRAETLQLSQQFISHTSDLYIFDYLWKKYACLVIKRPWVTSSVMSFSWVLIHLYMFHYKYYVNSFCRLVIAVSRAAILFFSRRCHFPSCHSLLLWPRTYVDIVLFLRLLLFAYITRLQIPKSIGGN